MLDRNKISVGELRKACALNHDELSALLSKVKGAWGLALPAELTNLLKVNERRKCNPGQPFDDKILTALVDQFQQSIIGACSGWAGCAEFINGQSNYPASPWIERIIRCLHGLFDGALKESEDHRYEKILKDVTGLYFSEMTMIFQSALIDTVILNKCEAAGFLHNELGISPTGVTKRMSHSEWERSLKVYERQQLVATSGLDEKIKSEWEDTIEGLRQHNAKFILEKGKKYPDEVWDFRKLYAAYHRALKQSREAIKDALKLSSVTEVSRLATNGKELGINKYRLPPLP